jgi:hypothetical protein
LIVARLEILHRVVSSFQCAVPGVEVSEGSEGGPDGNIQN